MKQAFLAKGILGLFSGFVFSLNLVAGATDCDPVPSGMAAWWQGEDNAFDAVGGNNGILENGTGFTTGEVGTAFEFNGSDNFVLVNPAVSTNLNVGVGDGLTFEAWINPTTVSTEEILFSYERILGSSDSTGADVGVILGIHADSGGILLGNLADVNNIGHIMASPGGILTPNTWQHIAWTYEKSSGTAAFYINGSAVAITNFGTFTPQTTFTNFMFGGHTAYNSLRSPGALYSGAMDEISLYDRALSTAEIKAIYEAGSAGKCPTPVPPAITTQPTNQSVSVGGTTSFAITASGSPTLTYQWSFDGTNIVGATNATLTLTDVQPGEAGDYSVSIANGYGSTNSAAAFLNVYGLPPFITAQPASQTLLVGASTSFSVTATGTAPLLYQWNLNGTNLPGATGTSLALTDVQLDQAGNYSVSVANGYGSTNSVTAALTVNLAPTCDPAPSGIVAWWQGNDSAWDAIGGNNGILENGTGFTTGEVGTAFEFNGANNYILVNSATPSSIDIARGSGLTFEEWIDPATVSKEQILFEYEQALGTFSGSDVGISAAIHAAPPSGIFFANIIDTNDDSHILTSPVNLLTAGVWQHIALTYDQASGLASFYLNGVAVSVTNLGSFTPQTSFTNFLIGGRTTFNSVTGPGAVYAGAMDEISLYDRALSATEIQAIYQAGSAGKCFTPTPPVITAEPVNTTNMEGSTAVFSVFATASEPLTYQWSFDGQNIVGATNAVLTLADVQTSQTGAYVVTVSDSAGSTNSTIAMLWVTPLTATPVPSGLIAWWKGEDNALDSAGLNNGTLENGVGFTNGEVGRAFNFPAVSFPYSRPTNGPSVQVPYTSLWALDTNNFSIELWANFSSRLSSSFGYPFGGVMIADDQGSGGNNKWMFAYAGGVLEFHINGPTINDGSGVYLVKTPFAPVLNQWYHLAITRNGDLYTIYTNGVAAGSQTDTNAIPAANVPLTIGAAEGFYFNGKLDEVSIYDQALTAAEITEIYQSGSMGKTPVAPVIASQPTNQTVLLGGTASFAVTPTGTPPFGYQWSFDGTNIVGATSAVLTLTDVLPAQAGTYAVAVSNNSGATNSTGATLTVVNPPVITQQPQSLNVIPFGTASFSVVATGTGPLTYQWQDNGTNLVDNDTISGSTTTNLTIINVDMAEAGNYEVLVTSPYASTNSAVAVLTVSETTFSLGSTNAMSGTTITVPVIMNALGIESGFMGSVVYDPTKLVLQTIVGPSPNYNQTNNGFIGFLASPTVGNTFAPGSNVVAELVFVTLPVTNNTAVTLAFGNTPDNLNLTDLSFDNLPAVYEGGVVQLTPAEYCADVYPRFNGNHVVDLNDWQEVGRMVAGLDVPTNSDEFLRADCAPRNAPDGVLTVADWVQAGRYVLGLDPLTLVPTTGSSVVANAKPLDGQTTSRILQVATVSAQRSQTVSVPVSLVCVTNENAVGFTVRYNTNQLRLVSCAPGSAVATSHWIVNSNQVGKLGLMMSAPTGKMFAAGTNQVALLTFTTTASASGAAAVTLDSSVVKLQTADVLASSLATTYVNGAVALPSQPNLAATLSSGNLQFNWSLNSGTFQVQSADAPTGPWTTLALSQTVSGTNVTSVLSTTNQQKFFRLQGQ